MLPTILLIVSSVTCTFGTAAKPVTQCIRRPTIAHHRQQAESADRRKTESRRVRPKHARKRQSVRRLARPSPEPHSNSIREFTLAVSLLGTVDLPTPLRESAGIRPAACPWRLRARGVSGSTSANKYLWHGAFPLAEKSGEARPHQARQWRLNTGPPVARGWRTACIWVASCRFSTMQREPARLEAEYTVAARARRDRQRR